MAEGGNTKAVSKVFIAALILLFVSVTFQIVGFSTDHWTESDFSGGTFKGLGLSVNNGLWRRCYCLTSASCVCLYYEEPIPATVDIITKSLILLSSDIDTAWLQAVRILETIGLAGLVITGVLMAFSMCYPNKTGLKIIALVLTFISGAFILAGVVVYGANQLDTVRYSFGLCIVAVFFVILTAIVLINDMKRGPHSQPHKRSLKGNESPWKQNATTTTICLR